MGFRASWLPYLGLPLNGGPGVHRRVWCTSRGTATTLSGGGSPGLPYPRASLRYEEKKEGKKEEEEVRRRRPLEEARWGALAPRLKLSRKGLGRPGKSWPASERGWAGRPAEQDARDQPPLKEKIVCVPGGWVGAREHEGCSVVAWSAKETVGPWKPINPRHLYFYILENRECSWRHDF